MDEMRKVQKIGYSTLSISIPSEFAKDLNLKQGDKVLIREEVDGTLRLIPTTSARKSSKATVLADQIKNEELISRLIIGCYALGYDTIEVINKSGLSASTIEQTTATVRKLRGLEIVDSEEWKIVAQSFMDPTRFPVDSLIKRLQILVMRSLSNIIEVLEDGPLARLNEVKRIQDEIDGLYWLIVRQLLVALNHREMASKIGIESPLHASGDRVTAKTLVEIGNVILEIAEELVRLRGSGGKIERKVLSDFIKLAKKAQNTLENTVQSLFVPDIRLIEQSLDLINETLQTERELNYVLLGSDYSHTRIIASYFGQLVRYCGIIIEIALHRLLRKSSRVAVVEYQ